MAGKIPPDAFAYYHALGSGRSYQGVAEHFGVSKRSVVDRAVKENWQARLAEVEAKARAAADDRIVETLDALNGRHLRMLRMIQGKAIEALKSMPLATAMDAVRALDMSIKQERTILGEPADRTAVRVEDVVRKEHDRWLSWNGSRGDGGED